LEQQDIDRLRRQAMLTPGDFAAVSRQHRFRPLGSGAELVRALEQETALKRGKPAPIGFVS
jgi:hypothetical protein